MINGEKNTHALYAIHSILTRVRYLAYKSESHKNIAEILNYAESLPRFLASSEDQTEDFIKYLEALADFHPPFLYVLERFNSPVIPENW